MFKTQIRKRLRILLPLFLFLLGAAVFVDSLSAQTLYVKKSGTKLQATDSARSKVVAKLNRGTAVKVLKKSKRFYQVSAPGGKKGWIFKFRLTSKAPSRSGGGDFLGALGGRQQIAARESSSGSSIRGLSPISEQHAKNKGISKENIEAVKQMESFRVSPEAMDNFLKQGRLGEYGQ
ncbi:MAG: SH3 domain-containing protein [Nitrospinaceae bacterium]